MQKILTHLGDRLPIYLLITVIGGLMLYYAMVYVPRNENTFDSHGVHVLANKAQAIVEKYRGYERAVNSAPLSYLGGWYFACNPFKTTLYVRDQSTSLGRIYFSDIATQFCKDPITRDDIDHRARIDKNLIHRRRLNIIDTTQEQIKRIWKDDQGISHFVFTPSAVFYGGELAAGKLKWNQQYPCLTLPIADFTANLKENDFFQDVFLLRAETCKTCVGTGRAAETAGYGHYILDESKLGLAVFNPEDSTDNASSGIYTQSIFGKKYKVYFQLVKLRTGVDLYLVGLIPLDVFKGEAKKVSVWFLVFCSLGALLLIFLFPVLKLFLLGPGERLSTNDISFGVFSVMLCTCLCITVAAGYYFFWGLEVQRSDEDIKALAENIREQTRTEIKVFENALDDRDLFKGKIINTSRVDSLIKGYDFNEIFQLELAGPSAGAMKSMYTLKDNIPDLDVFPVNVSDRNYFKAIRDNPDLDYFVQSINSYASGKSEVAVSKHIKTTDGDAVGVITTPLRSILQAGVPSPYEFILLDHQGGVKFHSGWNQIRSENFLSQLGNDALLSACLNNSVTDFVDFTHLGRDCRGYIVPVLKDWSVLVYFEKSWIYNLSAQIFIMCMASLFIVVLFCMILHFVIREDEVKPVLLKTRPFLYNWLNPNHCTASTWWYLFRLNLVILLLGVIGLFVLDSFVSSLFFSLLSIACAYLINQYTLKSNIRNITVIIMTAIIVALAVCFVLSDLSHWYLFLPVIGCVILSVRKKAYKAIDHKDLNSVSYRENVFMAYRFFMISLLLIIIIGPSIGSLIKHYRHEKLLTKSSFLLQDLRKLRSLEKSVGDQKDIPYYAVLAQEKAEIDSARTSLWDYYDSIYYNQFPKFAALNPKGVPFVSSYIPSMKDVSVTRYGESLEATASTNMIDIPVTPLHCYTRLDTAFRFNAKAVLSIVLVLGMLGLLYWILAKVTRKIFYLPKHSAWNNEPLPQVNSGDIPIEHGSPAATTAPVQKDNKENATSATNEAEDWMNEKLILEEQEKRKKNYQEYWKNLDPEVQFFLYDLAEDGIAHQPDEAVLKKLSDEKKIRLFPRLEFVSTSFANFIRTLKPKDDETKMQELENKDGRWKQARVLLVITIIAAFAFLSIAEESFFGRATALIGSITLLLPNIITMLGSMTKLLTKGSA